MAASSWRGDLGAKVSINIVWGTNAEAVSQTVSLGDLNADYKKVMFSFKAEHSGAAQFEIVGTGTGAFHVGAVSLMPADNLKGFKPACHRRAQEPSLRRLSFPRRQLCFRP